MSGGGRSQSPTSRLVDQLQHADASDRETLLRLVSELKQGQQVQNDWCEAAGQSEPLTTRLKNLLKDYPADVGLFKEMVQNADDAGATRVHFVWDPRNHRTERLLTPQMARWQGSCLWAYNDAIFTEQDYEAICNLGVGGKRSSEARIGRFGLGFNSVYNLTDMPSIFSQDTILFLDPHVRHLKAMGASNAKPGIKLHVRKVDVLKEFPGQFEPYHRLLGCDMRSNAESFKGTLIRVPFRTAETAKDSEVSKIAVDTAMVETLIKQFKAEAFQWLLFLQHVREIQMSRITGTNEDGSAILESLGTVALGGDQRSTRPSIVTCGPAEKWGSTASGSNPSNVTATLDIRMAATSTDSGIRRYHLFTDTRHKFRTRVCLAIPLAVDHDAVADLEKHGEEGRVFCFLPVPRNVDLGLRVHVHAPLNMAQDRRSVLLDERVGEAEREMVRHNVELLDQLVPNALLDCLTDLAVRQNQTPPARFFGLFPALGHHVAATPAERVAQTFYTRLVSGGKDCPPLPVSSFGSSGSTSPRHAQARSEAPPSHWVKFTEAVFVPSADLVRSTEGGSSASRSTARTPERLIDEVVQRLLSVGVPLVDACGPVLESIERALRPKPVTILTPRWLRKFLRDAAGDKKILPLKGSNGAQGLFGEMTPEDIANCLEFALSDGDVMDLAGVPLLLCEDEEVVQVFHTDNKVGLAFIPENENERMLFPRGREGRRCCVSSRLEKRPVVWARLREMAQAHCDQRAASGRPSFQCRLIDFPLLVGALTKLLPRTWNEPVPRLTVSDWNEWVETWLKATWKWLGLKGISLSRLQQWPLIPSLPANGPPCLHRVPEPTKTVLFSVANDPVTPKVNGSDKTHAVGAGTPLEAVPAQRSDTAMAMAELLEKRLGCVPITEPPWLLQNHENELRCHVHAGTSEGFLLTMHFALKLKGSAPPPPPGGAAPSAKQGAPQCGFRAALNQELSPQHVRALVVTSALAQRGGCSCESASGPDWKSRCQVVRSLPLFCRFNQAMRGVALLDAGPAKLSLLPEICPEVITALRAGGVDLPACVEIPPYVLEGLAEPESNLVASLLRELAVPRLKWANVLLDHVFPWAGQSSDLTSTQGLMLAVVYRWRAMELSGNDRCIEALQQVPFVSTMGGQVLCPRQVLDPAVEELKLLYGTDGSTGPFPDARFLASECRQVLKYRRELDCGEICERVLHLHNFEVHRRAAASDAVATEREEMVRGQAGKPRQSRRLQDPASGDGIIKTAAGDPSNETGEDEPKPPEDPPKPIDRLQQNIPIAEALVRYVIEHVIPLVVKEKEEANAPKREERKPAPRLPPPPPKPEVKAPADFWTGLTTMFSSETTAALSQTTNVGSASSAVAKTPQRPPGALSSEELFSLRTKLQACAWLPAAKPPAGWPASAPWSGRGHGLCFAAEVRLASEDALVGMVYPLVGPPAPPPKRSFGSADNTVGETGVPSGTSIRVTLPRAFLEMLKMEEKPQKLMMQKQMACLEQWAEALPAADLGAHGSWITQILYDHLYPGILPAKADVEANGKETLEQVAAQIPKLWVLHGGFLPLTRIAKQTMDFPPYLVRAPAEWKEKLPFIWAHTKDLFNVRDCAEALGCIHGGQDKSGGGALDANKLDMAVRLVMAITDMVQQERNAGKQDALMGGTSEQIKILMPTVDSTLRPVNECVFNNMTWLPDVETADVSLGDFCLVHSKISHAVAHTCGCRGLSLVYAREATEMAGADWFEAAGQSEPMTTRLKNLLKDYPADISIFKEMTQNADDAGATKVHFVWDFRQFRKQSLLTPDMDRWQGPCLWIYNDAIFSESDFDSICRLGVGGKRESSRKIGRFGLGFNAAYNLTDLPTILSNDVVLFLDPHVRHLQAMGATVQKPGIKMRFKKINVLEKFRDQFEPYHGLLGCDLTSSTSFPGTLIRVPFRTPEVAKSSEISNIAVDRTIMEALCAQFQAEASQWLLFLQNVVDVEVSEIHEGASGPFSLRSIARVRLQNNVPRALSTDAGESEDAAEKPFSLGQKVERRVDDGEWGFGVVTSVQPLLVSFDENPDPNTPGTSWPQVRAIAGVVPPPAKAAVPEPSSQNSRPSLAAAGDNGPQAPTNITVEVTLAGDSRGFLHRYRLISGLAKKMDEQVCIAVPLQQPPSQSNQAGKDGMLSLAQEEGRLFCFLPLPRSAVSLRVPVHVHAPLNTAQDRRSVLLDDRIGARDLIQHNLKLLDRHIPECLLRCLWDMSSQTSSEDLFRMFPVLNFNQQVQQGEATNTSGVAERVAHAFYTLLISGKRSEVQIFPVVAPKLDQVVVPDWRVAYNAAIFFPEGGGPDAKAVNKGLVRETALVLARFGVPIVEIPQRLLDSLERVLHPAQPRVLTPTWLRQFLRSMSAPRDPKQTRHSFPLVEVAAEGAEESEKRKQRSRTPGVQIDYLTPLDAAILLEFVLSDGDTNDLEGVPLLVTDSLAAGTSAFSGGAGAPTIFVPEDEDEFNVLPRAPGRLIRRDLKTVRPRVWQQLRQMASDQKESNDMTDEKPASFQLRKLAFAPTIDALQGLLPRHWNQPLLEVTSADWNGWIETWIKAMWKWLARLSLSVSELMHWPLIPSVQVEYVPQKGKDKAPQELSNAAVDAGIVAESQEVKDPAAELEHAAASQERNGPAAVNGTAPGVHIQKVFLHRVVPDSVLFSAPSLMGDSGTNGDAAAEANLWENRTGNAASMRKRMADLLEQRLNCIPVYEPQWLLQHEKYLRDFVHAGTPEGMLKTAHNCMKSGQKNKDPKDAYREAVSRIRQAFEGELTGGELSALAVWIGLAQRDGCSCRSSQVPGWKPLCTVVRAVPLFCPFSQHEKKVALADFEPPEKPAQQEEAVAEGGDRDAPKPAMGWSTLPVTCPEVVAALRAANVQLAGVVEVPPVLESRNAASVAVTDAVAALLKELSLPQLTWVDIMLRYVFPWACGPAQHQARQGLMLAVVQQWRAMELGSSERCAATLQGVPFVTTVGGEVLSPSQLLDPSAEELRRLYGPEGKTGPFPSAELAAKLGSVPVKGLLRFRREMSVAELVERLTFLHKRSSPPEATDAIIGISESLLHYMADHVAERCAPKPGNDDGDETSSVAVPARGSSSAASGTSGLQQAASAFFLWPAAMRGVVGMNSSAEKALPEVEWSEDQIQMLQSKIRACNWLPAAKPPREWLSMVPWAGSEPRLWRSEMMRLISEFNTCGAAMPLLCLDTQLGGSGDRKEKGPLLLQLFGLPECMNESERRRVAWAQLEVVTNWWKGCSMEDRSTPGAVGWVINCLYSHVYPHLDPRPAPPSMPAELVGEESEATDSQSLKAQSTVLSEIFIDGNFVALEDISLEQGFTAAGLHVLPGGVRGIQSIRRTVKPLFNTCDCGRALERLQAHLTAENRPQLNPPEVDAAVRLAIALADRVRTKDEALPENLLVPTQRGTLRRAQGCVFNNMKWLSPEEQQKRSTVVTTAGLDWVHASISNDIAGTLHVRGLNAQVAAEAMGDGGDHGDDQSSWFEAAGQTEPLTTRLRFLLQDMTNVVNASELSIFKELIQNADDAQASEVNFVWDWRRHNTQSLMVPEMAPGQGPCLWAYNDAKFSPQDFDNIMQLGKMGKRAKGTTQVGRFGLGFNSVYNVTDLPSILSDDIVLFLDPHVRHLRSMGASAVKPGIKLRFLKIDVLDKFRDQFEPYHGLFGCDLKSQSPYPGTLIRIPFRSPESCQKSEISQFVMTPARAAETLVAFRMAAAECLIFLQNVKSIKFSWIGPDAGPDAQPQTLVEVKIEPSGGNAPPAAGNSVAPVGPSGMTAATAAENIVAPTAGIPTERTDEQAPLLGIPTARTDEQALECRKLFASRTLPESRKQRSFIVSLLGHLGWGTVSNSYSLLGQTEETAMQPEEPQPFATFNMVLTVSWESPRGGFAWPGKPNGQRVDVWRLFLRHDDAESLGWNVATTAVATSANGKNPFAEGQDEANAPAVPSVATGEIAPSAATADFVPFAGIALCLTRKLSTQEPRICCFLPLPVQSSLPFLLNANFMLTDPTSPSRLDLVASGPEGGNAGRGAEWNRLLMDKLVIPMVHACIKEQARCFHALQHGADLAELPCARWAMAEGGICTLMPARAHLPASFEELLDLKALYAGLGDVPLFPALEPPASPGAVSTSASPLYSFSASTQPLQGGASGAAEAQRQAVHDYIRDSGTLHLCSISEDISAEYDKAGVKRHALVSCALVIENLRAGRRPKDANVSAELLVYLLTGDLGNDPAGTLKGLPLAALCDGSVAELGNELGKRLWCAFPGGESQQAASNCQQVLEMLFPNSTLDLAKIGSQGAALLRRCATDEALGITDVNSSDRLAEAIKESGSHLCAQARQTPAAALAQAANFMGSILGVGTNHNESVSANVLGLGCLEHVNTMLVALWTFAQKVPGGLDDGFLTSFTDFFILPAADAEHLASQRVRIQAPSSNPFAADGNGPPPPPPPPPSGPDTSGPPAASFRTLDLLPLSAQKPLLMWSISGGERERTLRLLDIMACVLGDRFVDATHPAMTGPVVQFLLSTGAVKLFAPLAILAVLAAATGPRGDASQASYKAIVTRCSRLSSEQKHLLCDEMSAAFCAACEQGEETPEVKAQRVAAFCGLPIFLAEVGAQSFNGAVSGASGGDPENIGDSLAVVPDAARGGRAGKEPAWRALADLCVVDGEPIFLQVPPARLDLVSNFVFTQSPHTLPALAKSLGVEEVQEYLKARGNFVKPVDWLLANVVPRMADLTPEDQVTVLERLLPDLTEEQANTGAGLIPTEVQGGGVLLKAPIAILDAQDFLIQEIFGLGGAGNPVPLSRSSRLHFPSRCLPAPVRTQLRRLGMRQSANDAPCLVFLIQELKSRHGQLEPERYGELQRVLLQRVVESWDNLSGQAQQALITEPFVCLHPEVDGAELPEGLFSLRPYREQCVGRLLCLNQLITRHDPVDAYLSWTSAPLAPRNFPAFVGYSKPTLETVLAHTKIIGELADSGTVACHMWAEMRQRVIAPLCNFLAQSDPFRAKLSELSSTTSATAGEEVEVEPAAVEPAAVAPAAEPPAPARTPEEMERNRICSQLRRTKFLAVPLDGSETGPHSLVAPWRISLVLREHRPPMFALPEYLQEHIDLLRLLGVRDALEAPLGGGGGMAGGDRDAGMAAETAMRWLFEHGAESFSDVTIKCSGGNLYLHRNILMARSDYFRAMFQGGEFSFREGQDANGEVTLHRLENTVDVTRVLFGYLYYGRVDEAPLEGPEGTSNSVELLQLSDELNVPQLFEFAQLWVANQQDFVDCPDTLALAARHRADILEKATLSLLAANMDAPEVQELLPNLSAEHREALQNLVAQRPRRPQ